MPETATGAHTPATHPNPGLACREVEVMAAAGAHPHIISLLAACLEPPLAVIQVHGWRWWGWVWSLDLTCVGLGYTSI